MNLKQGIFLFIGVAISTSSAYDSWAATMNYGDFAGDTVTYRNVTESNGLDELVFAAPTIVGDSLVFQPVNFESEVNPGPNSHLLDSQLTTVIRANPGSQLAAIHVAEAGNYTLTGTPGSFAAANVGAAFFLRILEVDGVRRRDIPLITKNMTFTPSEGTYTLAEDGGTSLPYTGTVLLDLSAAALGLAPGERVTAVRLTFDNTLATAAEDVSAAHIQKTSFVVTPQIPEPSGATLCLMSLAWVICRGRPRVTTACA